MSQLIDDDYYHDSTLTSAYHNNNNNNNNDVVHFQQRSGRLFVAAKDETSETFASKLTEIPDWLRDYIKSQQRVVAWIEQSTPIIGTSTDVHILERTRAHLQSLLLTDKELIHLIPQGFFRPWKFGISLPGITYKPKPMSLAEFTNKGVRMEYPDAGSGLVTVYIDVAGETGTQSNDTSLPNSKDILAKNIDQFKKYEIVMPYVNGAEFEQFRQKFNDQLQIYRRQSISSTATSRVRWDNL